MKTEACPVYKTKQEENYKIKTKKYKGKDHLVVPVVMMVEGVHSGSHGPILHTIDELGKFPAAWNGIPAVIDHPADENGINISANDPQVLEKASVGRIFNTHVDGNRLRAEVWIDPEKLEKISPNTMKELKKTEIIEVSVGVFSENEEVENGDWNGEKYIAIARNHRPDHLALLPGSVGACSVKDGCGIRVNSAKGVDVRALSIQLNTAGFTVSPIVVNGEKSLGEKMDVIREAIRSKNNKDTYHYAEEVYDDYVIYSCEDGGQRTLYKQSYEIDDAGVKFIGLPKEVVKKISYVDASVGAFQRTKFKNGGIQMDTNEGKPCGGCMEKVIALIQSNATHFTAADREWLLTQEEAILDKLMPKTGEPVVNTVTKEVPITLSAEDQAALNYGKSQLKARRETLMQGIQANAKDVWTVDELQAMEINQLEKIAKSIESKSVVDYSLQANNGNNAGRATEEALYPSGITVK